jgi:hypothetical protein
MMSGPNTRSTAPAHSNHHNSKSRDAEEQDQPLGPLNEAFKFFMANLPLDASPHDIRQHFSVRSSIVVVVLFS